MKHRVKIVTAVATAAALGLVACGGGGGPAGKTPLLSTPSSASPVSAGTITAFGSVFVDGQEFSTQGAQWVDDDSGVLSSDLSPLEVGMAVEVVPAAASTNADPVASLIHVDPLARGIVDASDAGASTITVMGQTVQLTAATNFSDHRACVSAASAPCSAITGQSGLTATTGSGASAVAGNYVTVHGFLFSGGANIVATLVSVGDAPTATNGPNYKAEGAVAAVTGSSLTIGGLTVSLSGASCWVSGATTPCASAYSSGEVVSVFAAAQPALPATTFAATTAQLRNKLPVETVGATVELEGAVSSVSTAAPAQIVMRGVTVDVSAIAGSLPAVGDDVLVTGTVAAGGSSVTASALQILRVAQSATLGLEGDVTSVAAGSASGTWLVNLLGQTVTVNAQTLLADRSVGGWSPPSSTNPFNATTFQTYLAASSSQHVQVRAAVDASGNLTAQALTIVAASTVAEVSGTVDASPAPVTSGTPETFSVHGLAVSAAAAAIVDLGGGRGAQGKVAAGDFVLVRGTWAAPTLSVAAPSGNGPGLFSNQVVIDEGPPRGNAQACF